MVDPPSSPSDDPKAVRRTPLPGWAWIALVAIAVGGALLAGWWFGRDDAVTQAPRQPEVFCNTVGQLQRTGDITVDVSAGVDGTKGLRGAADGLRRLADAGPPAAIRADLEEVATAVDDVVAEAEAVAPDDPNGLSQVLGVLDQRLRGVQAASDRVNAYTERWCGASVNPSPTTG
jgi:hypothetical protein